MSNLKAIHEATRLQPINKLMVVGHPLSGYAAVEQVLHGSGLQAAAASKTQGLSPTQVSDMLLRAYRVPPLEATHALEALSPINPSPVWQTLALDLLVGNLEQELWGWADPQAIYLLDYWKNLDHQLAFVLVYDSPQASMAGLFDNPEVDCTEDVVQAGSANWLAYNEALLNFYLGNTERCLLVHGQQVRAKTADYLKQVKHQMGVELQMPVGEALREANSQSSSSWLAMKTQLCSRVLAANPKVTQMYADLQSVASLPQGHVKNQPSFDTDMAVLSKFVALHRSNLKIQRYVEELKAAKEAQEQALNQQLATLVQSFEKAHAYGHAMAQEKQHLAALVEDRQRNIEELRQKEAELLSRVGELDGQLQQARNEVNQHAAVVAADYVTSNKALEEENDMLLVEFHKVQEELERTLKQININKYRVSQAEEKLNLVGLNGAIDIIRNSKTYRLGYELVTCNRSIKSYIKLPIGLYRISKKYTNQIDGLEIKNINFTNYSDGYHAYQIKKHLSYKFGEIIEETNLNPFMLLIFPFRLINTYKKWKLDN